MKKIASFQKKFGGLVFDESGDFDYDDDEGVDVEVVGVVDQIEWLLLGWCS